LFLFADDPDAIVDPHIELAHVSESRFLNPLLLLAGCE
jgi:hypothetical protein